MKKLILVLALALASIASAANFTIVLTAAQVSAIQYAYSLAPDKVKYPTAQEWFAAQAVNVLVNQYAQAQAGAKAASFCTRFKAASQPNQDAICSNLGLSAGCDPCAQ